MATPVATGLTYADLERMPEDECVKHELIDGRLYVTAKPAWTHQAVAVRIARRLLDYTDIHGGGVAGEPGVYYSETNFVAPDVVLVTAETLARMDPRHVDEAPALIVEVSSPSTRHFDLGEKLALYEREGVPEYWFADMDAGHIRVYRVGTDGRYGAPEIAGPGDQIAPPHLPGLRIEVDDAFAVPH